jgi:hypothetical protein
MRCRALGYGKKWIKINEGGFVNTSAIPRLGIREWSDHQPVGLFIDLELRGLNN